MDENLLAVKMMEMAKTDMKHVKAKGALGENPHWNKSKEYTSAQKRGGRQGRPDSYKTKINERLDKGISIDDIVAELGCSRNIVNQYIRKRRLEQNAASSHAA
jgi:hypothetical protein